jgi:multidrug efflux pump subunit AcrB
VRVNGQFASEESLKAINLRVNDRFFPIGLGVHLVADQPVVVEHAVSGFAEALFEAVVIVLGISFLSLGLRAGLVVAIAIPWFRRSRSW